MFYHRLYNIVIYGTQSQWFWSNEYRLPAFKSLWCLYVFFSLKCIICWNWHMYDFLHFLGPDILATFCVFPTVWKHTLYLYGNLIVRKIRFLIPNIRIVGFFIFICHVFSVPCLLYLMHSLNTLLPLSDFYNMMIFYFQDTL